jgi:hypothetical protein
VDSADSLKIQGQPSFAKVSKNLISARDLHSLPGQPVATEMTGPATTDGNFANWQISLRFEDLHVSGLISQGPADRKIARTLTDTDRAFTSTKMTPQNPHSKRQHG